MFKTFRPVGNRIITKASPVELERFHPYHVHFFQSGTAALAAAIIASIRVKDISASEAEIIVPAYGCPDLISAIVYTGAKPVLVDLEVNRPWMSLTAIKHAITAQTCAIVAVNFLGISERMADITKIANENNLLSINDSAQGFPRSSHDDYWCGDLNIISFGRGKPVNLLGGGALLYKNEPLSDAIPTAVAASNDSISKYKYRLKQYLYNIIKSPVIYNLLVKAPGLNIGKTLYKPLLQLSQIADIRLQYLNANIDYYQQRSLTSNLYQTIISQLKNPNVLDLAVSTRHDSSQPLLRYPLLIDKARDKIYAQLRPLGATKMYQKPLIAIDGVKAKLDSQLDSFPNAREFSRKLLSLPTHDDISTKEMTRIKNILTEALSEPL